MSAESYNKAIVEEYQNAPSLEDPGAAAVRARNNARSLDLKEFTRREAIILGRRDICYKEGHDLRVANMDYRGGGIQGENAACDEIRCARCDVVFAATYPEL